MTCRNLVPLAKSLGYIDMNNLFLFGWSRGGMMSLIALQKQPPCKRSSSRWSFD